MPYDEFADQSLEDEIPVLAFDSDDPAFIRGVEVGATWEQLSGDDEVVVSVHAANAEMMLRMGEATNRRVVAEGLNDDWMVVRFDRPEL